MPDYETIILILGGGGMAVLLLREVLQFLVKWRQVAAGHDPNDDPKVREHHLSFDKDLADELQRGADRLDGLPITDRLNQINDLWTWHQTTDEDGVHTWKVPRSLVHSLQTLADDHRRLSTLVEGLTVSAVRNKRELKIVMDALMRIEEGSVGPVSKEDYKVPGDT